MRKKFKFGKFEIKINNYPNVLRFLEYWTKDKPKDSRIKEPYIFDNCDGETLEVRFR